MPLLNDVYEDNRPDIDMIEDVEVQFDREFEQRREEDFDDED